MLLNYSYSQRIHSAMAVWVFLFLSKLPKSEYDFFEVPDCKSFYDYCLSTMCLCSIESQRVLWCKKKKIMQQQINKTNNSTAELGGWLLVCLKNNTSRFIRCFSPPKYPQNTNSVLWLVYSTCEALICFIQEVSNALFSPEYLWPWGQLIFICYYGPWRRELFQICQSLLSFYAMSALWHF